MKVLNNLRRSVNYPLHLVNNLFLVKGWSLSLPDHLPDLKQSVNYPLYLVNLFLVKGWSMSLPDHLLDRLSDLNLLDHLLDHLLDRLSDLNILDRLLDHLLDHLLDRLLEHLLVELSLERKNVLVNIVKRRQLDPIPDLFAALGANAALSFSIQTIVAQ